MNDFEVFSQLHYSETPLLIGNVWDVPSARTMEENGMKAIATSSAAVANSMGYDDGQQIPFRLLFEAVRRIKKTTALPLSVDMERGYSNTIPGILQNIDKLVDAGIAGINIEDSAREKRLRSVESFQKLLSCIRNHLAKKNQQLFLNIRTDAFLLKLPNAAEETLLRARAYEAAGADGIFVPFLTDIAIIKKTVETTTLPLNVFFCAGLPGFKALTEAGVKRISMGTALFRAMKKDLSARVNEIVQAQSADSLF